MPVCADELIGYADGVIANCADDEAQLRAAASRSYYAVYHEALRVAELFALPTVKSNVGDHEKLILRFKAGGKRLSAIAGMIAIAKRVRHEADYKLVNHFHRKETSKHILQCRTIMAELRRVSATQTGTS